MSVGLRLYQSQGLEPRDFDLVVCKSPNGFRIHYEAIAARIVAVDVPGLYQRQSQNIALPTLRAPHLPAGRRCRAAF